jgi:hypothetical protein
MTTRTDDVVERVKKEVTALDAFLSVDPKRPKDTREVHIKSLGVSVTIRELDESEINDILSRYEADQERKAEGAPVNTIDQQARIVAMAMIDPNLRDPAVLDKLHARFGCGQNAEMALRAVLRPLEITKLANIVMEISGMSDDAVRVAGN